MYENLGFKLTSIVDALTRRFWQHVRTSLLKRWKYSESIFIDGQLAFHCGSRVGDRSIITFKVLSKEIEFLIFHNLQARKLDSETLSKTKF